ncbi:hypothetical protein D8674_034221 [Pyrus ussuriensis x Pyrus communis]|uniref:Uncharacterized protein n=1 Tax=Pyrus ussuriensis x Pyrus communis TaxID=2448454 RepID=A0A5N5HNC0_9ROSA|nr:hypothetical protein D8674_034221 [Pyrus ussuriensis x Pyrus communis]
MSIYIDMKRRDNMCVCVCVCVCTHIYTYCHVASYPHKASRGVVVGGRVGRISNTITILVKESDSQDRGTTLKLYAPLNGPKLSQDARGKSGVKISSWIRFWYWEDIRYKKSLNKRDGNMTTKPKGDSYPSSAIGSARRCSPAELRAFEDLGIASEHVEESYLAAFLACWLCKFVFPTCDVNFVCPGVFKVASKMVVSESFSLAILVLANIYNGLSVVSNSTSTEDHAAVLPYHYMYDKSGPSSLTSVKLGPLMTKYSGVLSLKSLDDSQAQVLFRSCEGLRMDHLAKVGSVQ